MITKTVYNKAKAITLSDTANIDSTGASLTDALYIGTKGSTGTAVVVMEDDSAVTFVGLAAGSILPIRIKRINNTTTDVSNVVALYQV